MANSDDEDILFDSHPGRNLVGKESYKNMDDVLNEGNTDKRKLRKTLALCLAFVCMGLCLAIIGPTVPNLQEQLNTTLPWVSLVFAGRGVGYMVGASLAGASFDSINPLLLIGASMIVCGIGVTGAPYAQSVFALGLAISTVGTTMGLLDNGAKLMCLRMWGKKRSPAMLQALYLSFAIGAFIAPLLAAQFLAHPGSSVVETPSLAPSTSPMPLSKVTDLPNNLDINNDSELSKDKRDQGDDIKTSQDTQNNGSKTKGEDAQQSSGVNADQSQEKQTDDGDNSEGNKTTAVLEQPNSTTAKRKKRKVEYRNMQEKGNNAFRVKEQIDWQDDDNIKKVLRKRESRKLSLSERIEIYKTKSRLRGLLDDFPHSEYVETINYVIDSLTKLLSLKSYTQNEQLEIQDFIKETDELENALHTQESSTIEPSSRISDNTSLNASILHTTSVVASTEATYTTVSDYWTTPNAIDSEEILPDHGQQRTNFSNNSKQLNESNETFELNRTTIIDGPILNSTSIVMVPTEPSNSNVTTPDSIGLQSKQNLSDSDQHITNTSDQKLSDNPDHQVKNTNEDDDDTDIVFLTTEGPTDNATNILGNITNISNALVKDDGRYRKSYVIIGVTVMLCALVFVYFFCTKPKDEPSNTGYDLSQGANNTCTFRSQILALLFAFSFLYVGVEVSFGGLLSTFAVESDDLQLSRDRASRVSALFWGTFAIGRGLSFCLASVLSPFRILIADLVGCVGASTLLSFYAKGNENMLWLGSAILGLSMASLYPNAIKWFKGYISMSGTAGTILIVGSSLGSAIVPPAVSCLFDVKLLGPVALMYAMLAISALSALIFVYVVWMASESGQERASLPEEKSPALEIVQSVEGALPHEDASFKNGHNGEQSKTNLISQKLKIKKHKE